MSPDNRVFTEVAETSEGGEEGWKSSLWGRLFESRFPVLREGVGWTPHLRDRRGTIGSLWPSRHPPSLYSFEGVGALPNVGSPLPLPAGKPLRIPGSRTLARGGAGCLRGERGRRRVREGSGVSLGVGARSAKRLSLTPPLLRAPQERTSRTPEGTHAWPRRGGAFCVGSVTGGHPKPGHTRLLRSPRGPGSAGLPRGYSLWPRPTGVRASSGVGEALGAASGVRLRARGRVQKQQPLRGATILARPGPPARAATKEATATATRGPCAE